MNLRTRRIVLGAAAPIALAGLAFTTGCEDEPDTLGEQIEQQGDRVEERTDRLEDEFDDVPPARQGTQPPPQSSNPPPPPPPPPQGNPGNTPQ